MIKLKKTGIFEGFVWTFGERVFAQFVSTIVGIILARILLPNEYGVVSMVMVFINICDVFVNSGFGTALVQKKTVDDEDYGTAFTISFCISIVMYIMLFLISPYIAIFYNAPLIESILRIMGIRIVIASFNNIQQAYVQRRMQFKLFFLSTSIGTFLSGVFGVISAISGFGAWSIVIQYLSNSIIDTIVLNIAGKIRIIPCFNKKKAKEIFEFGSKVLGSSIIYTADSQIRSMAIGKVFGASDLAYYDQGNRYPALLVTSINSAMQKVLLPTFSRKQDDDLEMKESMRKCVRFSLFILAPILVGFASIANTWVKTILTEKWADAIPFIRLFCFYYLTRPFESTCHQALLAKGRSDIVLKVMILIDGTGLALALFAIFYLCNVLAVAWFMLLSTVISVISFSFCTSRIINYKFIEQIMDVGKFIFGALLMGSIVFLLGYLPINSFECLVIQILAGVMIYYMYVKVCKIEEYKIMKAIIGKISKN